MFLYALEILSLCYSCFQIKLSDNRDGVSVILNYLNSYDNIFNPALFINIGGESF